MLFWDISLPGVCSSDLPRAVLWHAFSVLEMNTKQALGLQNTQNEFEWRVVYMMHINAISSKVTQ